MAGSPSERRNLILNSVLIAIGLATAAFVLIAGEDVKGLGYWVAALALAAGIVGGRAGITITVGCTLLFGAILSVADTGWDSDEGEDQSSLIALVYLVVYPTYLLVVATAGALLGWIGRKLLLLARPAGN